jgi:hypothetical protein
MNKNKFDAILEEVQELREKDKYFDALARAKAVASIRYHKAFYDEDPEAVRYHKESYDSIDKVIDVYYEAQYVKGGEFTEKDFKNLEEFIRTLRENGYWYEKEGDEERFKDIFK